MIKAIDDIFLKHDESIRAYLLALRYIILQQDEDITEAVKYGMPFYCYHKKMVCYLWVHKKYKKPYLGIVEGKKISHPDLIQENRSRMKIMLFDTAKDVPIKTITKLMEEVLLLYK